MRRFVALLMMLLAWSAFPAAVAQPPEEPFVNEAKLPFDPIPGTAAKQYWGIHQGAGYRMEVPDDWNGQLLIFAHGLRGTGPELIVDDPPIRDYLVRNGFAWAASSYRRNGYVVDEAIEDTQALRDLFVERFREPDRTYLMGGSMGGHITAAGIERYPDTYDGAMPLCGVVGDVEFFDFFLDHAVVAAALADVPTVHPPPANYLLETVPAIQAALGYGPGLTLNARGQQLAAATKFLSGGERPLFDQAFAYWSGPETAVREVPDVPFLLVWYGLLSLLDSSLHANVSNADTVYQLDADPAQSEAEIELNADVLRVTPAPGAIPPFPIVTGNLPVKVLSMHTIGDLLVPLSMEQVYAREAAANGVADRLVVRAIRDVTHCGFETEELEAGFADLVEWVEGGPRPASDDVLQAEAVADPVFGCQFTLVTRPGLPACPSTASAVEDLSAVAHHVAPDR